MRKIKTFLSDVFLIETNPYLDNRGSFSELFVDKFFQRGLKNKIQFCQDNLTYSKKGVIRGLHYQLPPFSQSKLVSVLKGKVLDIVVDIRKGSSTFGKYLSQELSEQNKLQIFVPRGFAHGYITLSESSIFYYKVDQYYHPEKEGSIAPSDPTLNIDWKLPKTSWIQSKKDQKYLFLNEAKLFDYNENLYG